jgi:hypothetical protein
MAGTRCKDVGAHRLERVRFWQGPPPGRSGLFVLTLFDLVSFTTCLPKFWTWPWWTGWRRCWIIGSGKRGKKAYFYVGWLSKVLRPTIHRWILQKVLGSYRRLSNAHFRKVPCVFSTQTYSHRVMAQESSCKLWTPSLCRLLHSYVTLPFRFLVDA